MSSRELISLYPEKMWVVMFPEGRSDDYSVELVTVTSKDAHHLHTADGKTTLRSWCYESKEEAIAKAKYMTEDAQRHRDSISRDVIEATVDAIAEIPEKLSDVSISKTSIAKHLIDWVKDSFPEYF